jgi:hypothetical protein
MFFFLVQVVLALAQHGVRYGVKLVRRRRPPRTTLHRGVLFVECTLQRSMFDDTCGIISFKTPMQVSAEDGERVLGWMKAEGLKPSAAEYEMLLGIMTADARWGLHSSSSRRNSPASAIAQNPSTHADWQGLGVCRSLSWKRILAGMAADGGANRLCSVLMSIRNLGSSHHSRSMHCLTRLHARPDASISKTHPHTLIRIHVCLCPLLASPSHLSLPPTRAQMQSRSGRLIAASACT